MVIGIIYPIAYTVKTQSLSLALTSAFAPARVRVKVVKAAVIVA